MVFVSGAGYTFNYLVITSSDGGRFLEYILMPFGVNLALGTPWYNNALAVVDPSVLMVIMLIVGAFTASLLSGDFKIRVPHERKRLVIGFLGGILVGIGVRVALGCNIGMMWTNFAQLGYDGILFLISMLGGVGLAIKVQQTFSVRCNDNVTRHSKESFATQVPYCTIGVIAVCGRMVPILRRLYSGSKPSTRPAQQLLCLRSVPASLGLPASTPRFHLCYCSNCSRDVSVLPGALYPVQESNIKDRSEPLGYSL